MRTRLEKEMAKLKTYRVYVYVGNDAQGEVFDEYCQALNAQHAVDRVREWFSDREGVVIEEVSKVVKGWK